MRRVLIPLDGSAEAEEALPCALACRADELVLVQVGEGDPRYLERVAREVGARCRWGRGRPAEAILQAARDEKVDLIAMTSHGRSGLARLVLGSVAGEVAAGASCPVLLVRIRTGRMVPEFRRVLVALDPARPESERVLEAVGRVVTVRPASLMLLAATGLDPSRELLARLEVYLQQVASRLNDFDVRYRIEVERPSEAILDLAGWERVDLIAMATRGMTGLEAFLKGSVTEQVWNQMKCALLLVNASGHEWPSEG